MLSLNKAGLTDVGLNYLGESTMPKLKFLFIKGNHFTDLGKSIIYVLGMNHIHVYYRDSKEYFDLSNEDDELNFNELIIYGYITQKKQKRNK